jgi:ABC-type oligopeptide transport system substrate-binding subunit
MKKLKTTTNTATPRMVRRVATHLATGLALAATLSLAGCPEKGTAEKAGEAIDNAKDKVSDTLNPKGPAEKAGRSIDRATD